jgi:hypothetical protein
LEQLKNTSSPEAYQKLLDTLKYGGQSDIGAQIFTPLSKDVLKDVPKTVQPTYDTTEGGDQVAQAQSVHVGETNGIPVYANYDEKGQLTGFSGDQSYRAWVNGKQSYGGQWDASGNADPRQYTSRGGGFFGGLLSDVGGGIKDLVGSDLGKFALLAGAAYAGGAFDPSMFAGEAGGLGIPSALDVSGADMVTGGMAGVAPTAASGYAAADAVGQSGFDLPPEISTETPPSIDPDQSLKDAYGPIAPETPTETPPSIDPDQSLKDAYGPPPEAPPPPTGPNLN